MIEVVGFEVMDQRGHCPVAHELVQALTLEEADRTATTQLVGVVGADQAPVIADAVSVGVRPGEEEEPYIHQLECGDDNDIRFLELAAP